MNDQLQAQRDRIAAAVKEGRLTQEQADSIVIRPLTAEAMAYARTLEPVAKQIIDDAKEIRLAGMAAGEARYRVPIDRFPPQPLPHL